MERTPGIFARNCSVARIDKPTAAAFLSAHHRFGDASCRYRYGLFAERTSGKSEPSVAPGTLVAVGEFSSARRWLKDGRKISSFEWVRYASLSGMRVIGGMGKILEAFVGEVHPDDVMSYADASWSQKGEAYLRLGFEFEGKVEKNGFENLKFRKKFTSW